LPLIAFIIIIWLCLPFSKWLASHVYDAQGRLVALGEAVGNWVEEAEAVLVCFLS